MENSRPVHYMESTKLREKVQNLLKNDSVWKKPIICFIERRRLLWGRQSVFSTFLSNAFIPASAWMCWGSQVTGCRAPQSMIWDWSGTMDHVTHFHRLKHILLNWKKLGSCQGRFLLEVRSERQESMDMSYRKGNCAWKIISTVGFVKPWC